MADELLRLARESNDTRTKLALIEMATELRLELLRHPPRRRLLPFSSCRVGRRPCVSDDPVGPHIDESACSLKISRNLSHQKR
jgi:hypothetical protein